MSSAVKPVLITPQTEILSPEEAELYAKHKPHGFILFAKHCQNPTQLKELITDLKAAAGDHCIISTDQEGGRVARMRAPEWQNFPAPADMEDVYQTYRDIGHMIAAQGFNLDFAPCLDVVPVGGKCDAIGDRCFSHDPADAGVKGVQACLGLIDAGITPVIKHMPGHGRAEEDSHYHLPVVKAAEEELLGDLEAFKTVVRDVPKIAGMTAHVIYECWDDKPATLSPRIINDIIRGEIGFKGTLYSDDLVMKALDTYGDMVTRVHLGLDAGCDIAVPCHTSLEETKVILESF